MKIMVTLVGRCITKNELMTYLPSAICHIPSSVCPSLSSMIPSVMVNALPTTGIQCPNCTTICQKRRQPESLCHEIDLLLTLQWRHYGRDGVSNHQPHDSTLDRFIQTQVKGNIKAPRLWPLCGEITGDQWIPRTNGQERGKFFDLMTSSCALLTGVRGIHRWPIDSLINSQ